MPDLSPIEQMNKPVTGTIAGTGAMSVGAAVVLLMQSAGWMPDAWSEPVPAVALGIFSGWLFTTVGGFTGGYLARVKRFTAPAT